MKRHLFKWEVAAGITAIFLLGALFHFIFDFTGGWTPAGIFFPVNESVFEHLKLTYWPTVIYAAFSYRFIRASANNFLIAKAAALLTMPAVTLILFYGYTTLTGIENVIIDITIFLVAVACGQFASYGLLKANPLPARVSWLSLFVIIALAFIYIYFTFYPPHVPLFMDANTGTYGIPQ